MARPARVRIRNRNPWVLARRRLFGWNVRLLTRGLQKGKSDGGQRAETRHQACDGLQQVTRTPYGTGRSPRRSNLAGPATVPSVLWPPTSGRYRPGNLRLESFGCGELLEAQGGALL